MRVSKNQVPLVYNEHNIPMPSMLYSMLAWKQSGRKVLDRPADGECKYCKGMGRVMSAKNASSLNPDGIIFCLCQVQEYAQELMFTDEFRSRCPVKNLDEIVVKKGTEATPNTIGNITTRMKKWMDWPVIPVALVGGVGVGKTHILASIAGEFWPFAVYVTAADLEAKIYRFMKDDRVDELDEFYKSVPMLILDDLGAENGSQFVLSLLYRVIDFRYSMSERYADFSTIISSNLTMDELEDSKYKRIGTRLTDIHQTQVFVFDKSVKNFRREAVKK